MEHIVGRLDIVREQDLKRPSSRYFHRECSYLLPFELIQGGFRLISLEEQYGGDPVFLKDDNGRIVAYWDTYPSLTDLFELVGKLTK